MAYIKALPTVLAKTAHYTVATNDGDNVHVNVDATSGAATITLYAASGNAGKIISVKKTDSGTNAVTIDGNASETLDGALTTTLSQRADSITFLCDGTNWQQLVGASFDGLTQTFRGLTLRTSPNADVAATTVTLDHADEIVMQDGTRVADWDDLNAVITASGAGGLDTGSEGASRWYSIHAIRKSSDGTKNLLLHRAKSYDLDQSQTTNNGSIALKASAARTLIGQTYTPAITGYRPFHDITLSKNSSAVGYLRLSIYATSGGLPTGAALTVGRVLDQSLIAATAQRVRFVYDTPISLTAATVYALVLSSTQSVDVTNNISWYQSTVASYAGGQGVQQDGTTWTAIFAGYDFIFYDYVTQNDTALTMPSGYDQYAQVGWVYNNSSSNFRQFLQQDQSVVQETTSIVAAGTATIATLLDLAATVPPTPMAVRRWQITQSALASYVEIKPNLQSTNVSGFLRQQPVAAQLSDIEFEVQTELQHLYYGITSGNASIDVKGFKW